MRYPGLLIFSFYLRFISIILTIGGIGSGIWLINDAKVLNEFTQLTGIATIILTLTIFVPLYALGDLLQAIADIEINTRRNKNY